ncbi:MAG: YbhB/YbcL family Raf kinase inhibitor-like protein [Candidatus Brocadiia bacterium]
MRRGIAWLAIAALALAGCGDRKEPEEPLGGPEAATITITSPAFESGQPIPAKHTADGENVSPPLKWTGVPDGTRELALICDDPDAPADQPFVHWVLYKIPPDYMGLDEGESVGVEGRNGFGGTGYGGPAPPQGDAPHRYHFKVYALDAEIDLEPGAAKDQLVDAIGPHVIGNGLLVGTYGRAKKEKEKGNPSAE